MAEAALKSLSGKVNCGLCNHILYKPKILPCGHSYCQFCLDGIIQFDEAGKGHLTCPANNCEQNVKLNAKEIIVDKLKTNVALEDIIDVLKQYDEG